jgi:glycine/sarcosine N-methyltransferase
MADAIGAFYDQLAEEYDQLFADWDQTVRHQGQVIEHLLADHPGPVLDRAAGMGTQAIGLALQGRQVRARDLSAGLLDRGRREAARFGVAVDFRPGDLRVAEPDDAGQFAAVIILDNALPHLATQEELVAALAASRAALAPGGRLVTSTRDYDALAAARPALDPPRVLGKAPARRLVTQLWTWADDGSRYQLEVLILREQPDGEWRGRPRVGTYRALRRAELLEAAAAAGLRHGRWLTPEESGYFQPVFVADRD